MLPESPGLTRPVAIRVGNFCGTAILRPAVRMTAWRSRPLRRSPLTAFDQGQGWPESPQRGVARVWATTRVTPTTRLLASWANRRCRHWRRWAPQWRRAALFACESRRLLSPRRPREPHPAGRTADHSTRLDGRQEVPGRWPGWQWLRWRWRAVAGVVRRRVGRRASNC